MTLTINPSTHLKDSAFPVSKTDPKRWEALKRDLGIATSRSAFLPTNLPAPTDEHSFSVHGVNYRLLEYGKTGPDFKQTIEIAKRMGLQMLTIEDVDTVKGNKELSAAFQSGTDHTLWAFIRDTEAERLSIARDVRGDEESGLRPGHSQTTYCAPAVILREK